MNLVKKDALYQGKAKTLYATDQDEYLIADFRDDTTAFDGEKKEALENKGRVNCAISLFLMEYLQQQGIKTHFVSVLSENEVVVKRLRMVPLESVVRNIAAGSLCRRLGVESKMKLDPPLFEFFYKNDELHDPLVAREHALAFGWASSAEMDQMQQLSLRVHSLLTDLFKEKNMILVDAKYEFGVDSTGAVVLGDEISPDSCRIWDEDTLESLDKDRFRKGLGGVVDAYMEIARRLGIECVTDVS